MTFDLRAIRFVPNTKISHDYDGKDVDTFSYGHLIRNNIPHIGIPGKQNRLVIIDVDSAEMGGHKKDGREWWGNFHAENGIPPTYTVRTRSGGWHFYFRLPEGLDEDMFAPPGQLADGVDVKYNGWVAAPPTVGYSVYWGSIADIAYAPPSLMAEFTRRKLTGAAMEFDHTNQHNNILNMHTPYSDEQIVELRRRIEWFQQNGTLSRDEWRDGLFSLKAGLSERPDILKELATKWTINGAYQTGDEFEAYDIVERATPNGRVGPGTIYGILKGIEMRETAPMVSTSMSKEQIMDRARVRWSQKGDGTLKINPSESNAGSIIGAIFPVDELYYDTRQDQFMHKGHAISDAELTNIVTPMIQSEAFGLGIEKISKSVISQGIDILMHTRRIDPHVEYLKKLNWDGVQRIERFFPEYVGVNDTPYSRAVSRNFWVGMVARSMRPGTQFDYMVILEGHEGIRKSSLLRAIAGDYFYAPSNSKAFRDLDELRNMHQAILVELPELVGLNETGDRDVKNFLSMEQDTIRAPYAKKSVKKKRGFVFVGTTNESQYLGAGMGDRRFWPLSIPRHVRCIDTDRIKHDRDQLFAEALAYYATGKPFYEVPKDLHLEATMSRAINDPIKGVIERYLTVTPGYETMEGLFQRLQSSGIMSGGLSFKNAARISDTMNGFGWKEQNGVWVKAQDEMASMF